MEVLRTEAETEREALEARDKVNEREYSRKMIEYDRALFGEYVNTFEELKAFHKEEYRVFMIETYNPGQRKYHNETAENLVGYSALLWGCAPIPRPPQARPL